jgi:hypothetical protein
VVIGDFPLIALFVAVLIWSGVCEGMARKEEKDIKEHNPPLTGPPTHPETIILLITKIR